VAFLPDGSELLVALEGGALGRYRTQDGAELGTLQGHCGPVTNLVLSQDGRMALSAGEDHTVYLWDLARGDEAGRLHVGHRRVTHLALTPDARYAAVGLDDGRLISWPTRDTWAGLWMRWRQASRRALAGTARRASALLRRILNPDGERSKFVLPPRPAKRSVTALVLAAGGQRAITASRGGSIRVWNLQRGLMLHTLQHEEWENVALLPDGSYAVAHSLSLAFGYGRRQVWDLSTGTAIGELPAGTLLPKVFLIPGSEGNVELVAATTAVVKPESVAMKRFWEPERELSVWDLERGEAALSFVGDFDWTGVSVATDGRTVVAGDSVGQMHFLRCEELESLRPVGTR
jgi:WD40 repeat protein